MKTIGLILLFLTLPLSSVWADKRFSKDQVQFVLIESDGQSVSCSHSLLKHVPWWEVQCGERQYRVDLWLEERQSAEQGLSKLTLMYHVSEGVDSSGERLVQFKTHFTSIIVEDLTRVVALESDLDVRNGLASLNVRARVR